MPRDIHSGREDLGTLNQLSNQIPEVTADTAHLIPSLHSDIAPNVNQVGAMLAGCRRHQQEWVAWEPERLT